MNKETGGQAFPTDCNKNIIYGMTLRDYFAAKALSNPYTYSETDPSKIAAWAYAIADAMLEARK